jgi:hypothetical protein
MDDLSSGTASESRRATKRAVSVVKNLSHHALLSMNEGA